MKRRELLKLGAVATAASQLPFEAGCVLPPQAATTTLSATAPADFLARLDGQLAGDEDGFLLTGHEIEDPTEYSAGRPLFLETSRPGIFAVGDVRSGSIKRVASAVGEGSICIQLVHKVLNE